MSYQILSNIDLPNIRINKSNTDLLKKLIVLIKESKKHFNSNKSSIQVNKQIMQNEIIQTIPNFSYYPSAIQTHILNINTKMNFQFNLLLNGHSFNCNIITEKDFSEKNIMNTYIQFIYYWLYIATKVCNKKCSDTMNIYLFAISLEKQLPDYASILSQNNCNTAFTTSCMINTDLHLFRKEEWFKVFIHETFHNLGLDFSGIDKISNTILQNTFSIKDDIRAYESYTEIYAEMIMVLFLCSEKSNAQDEIIRLWKQEMRLEQQFSIFQAGKILKYYNLDYSDLLKKENSTVKYTEHTQVFSYYLLKLILMYHINDFLDWSNNNNKHIIQFKQTEQNIVSFCDFIIKKHNNPSLISYIDQAKQLVKKNNTKIMNTLRMTIHNFP
tara:strand:+ start:1192 stop:2343 length:1152 start_codon:yes stop_codon:yes gene_type:complete